MKPTGGWSAMFMRCLYLIHFKITGRWCFRAMMHSAKIHVRMSEDARRGKTGPILKVGDKAVAVNPRLAKPGHVFTITGVDPDGPGTYFIQLGESCPKFRVFACDLGYYNEAAENTL